MLRSFHAMHGLDYVALRYFNVYGPRMDIHGLYTEVLIRWMERIDGRPASADLRRRPPDDGLRLHRPTSPGRTCCAAESDVTDAVFNIGTSTETSLLELAEALLDVMGARPARWSSGRRARSTA